MEKIDQKRVTVTLSNSGEPFNTIQKVTRALKKEKRDDEAKEFAKLALDCDSFGDVLRLTMDRYDVN